MASWTDGPEYAPPTRPEAFVEPEAPALTTPERPSAAVTDVPEGEPGFVPSQEPAPDLRELVPSAAPGRNPNLPFESTATALTAIQPEVERRPDEPFHAPGPPLSGYLPVQSVVQPTAQVNPAPFPAPGTPQWFAPPSGAPVAPAPGPVDLAQIWRETTSWVMIPLLIAMFVVPVSPVALIVAWLCTVQIRYRRPAVRRVWMIAVILIGLVALVNTLSGQAGSIWEPLTFSSTVAAWILVFVTPGIVGAALRNQEPPDRY